MRPGFNYRSPDSVLPLNHCGSSSAANLVDCGFTAPNSLSQKLKKSTTNKTTPRITYFRSRVVFDRFLARSHVSLKDSHVNPAVAYEEMMDAEDDKVIKGLTKFMFVGKYIRSCDVDNILRT